MLNTSTRLAALCSEDAAALSQLRAKRESDVSAAERAARERTDRAVESAEGLSDVKSLGSRLRSQLGECGGVEVRHLDPGPPPLGFDDAIAEWSRIAPAAQLRVREFSEAHGAWSQRVLKRAKSAPTVEDALWRDLDRLDLIHRSLPALRQSAIADAIRTVAGAADVLYEAETERQNAGELHMAGELKDALKLVKSVVGLAAAPWTDPRWRSPSPAQAVETLVRLGELRPELPPFLGVESIPALVAFPFSAGIAVDAGVATRAAATGFIRSVLLRLFVAVPPGCLHVQVIDPVALGQSVAEFRHLGEFDAALMDEKTWTSEREIERVLADLSDHLEVVISRYLRGQFDSIDDYNRHAGEVAQPYRILVVLDYPAGFTDRASRKLLSLIENGPRCGVYTLLHTDVSGSAGLSDPKLAPSRLTRDMHRVLLNGAAGQLVLPEPVGSIHLNLLADEAPPIVFDADGHPVGGPALLLAAVGEAVRRQQENPPAVTLGTLLPVLTRMRSGTLPEFVAGAPEWTTDPATWWTATTADRAVAPIGRGGAQNVTAMHFSSTEIAGGAIMVGLPRSGKTTSLHALILTMSMLYSPEELEFFLIDAKHGVEFKAYEELPHARMVSVHSEREFSVAVLKSLNAEIRRRAELMKSDGRGRANITEYRQATGESLSRIVVVIDEFQEIFEEPDQLGQEAFAAFSDIVRMGPFSGVHIVVASQTLSSMPAMDRPTLMLLPQRVAFMCNEYDAEVVMGDSNRAPSRLTRTGEGLFNPARGEESRNQLFQGLLVAPDERAHIVDCLVSKAAQQGWTRQPRVFDGDAAVCRPLRASRGTGVANRLTVPVGEPFSLEERDELVLRRSRGSNVLLLGPGDGDRTALGALHSILLAAASQADSVTLLDFLGDDDDSGVLSLQQVARGLGVRYARSAGTADILGSALSTVMTRTTDGNYGSPTAVLVMVGLERALSFQPIDPYGDDETSQAASLLGILQAGPEVGVHVVIQADRVGAVERRLGSDALHELTIRIAGSGVGQQDLAAVSGQYGDVAPVRPGQLMIGDHVSGAARRVRGYEALTERDLAGSTEEFDGN